MSAAHWPMISAAHRPMISATHWLTSFYEFQGSISHCFLHDSQQLGLGNKVAQRNSNSIFPEFPQNFWAFKVVMCGSAELRLGWAMVSAAT